MPKRILAWITLLIIVGLIIAMIVSAILGNGYFLGFMFAAIAFPVVIYVIVWIRNLIKKYHPELEGERAEDSAADKGSEE